MVTIGSFNVTTTLAGGPTVSPSRQASAALRHMHAAAARCCRIRTDCWKPMMDARDQSKP
jgi:hypothetical protein